MTLTTTKKDTIITIPNNVNFTFLQDVLDYIAVKTIVSKSKATDKQIFDLAEEAQQEWWNKNKAKFVK